MNTSNYWSPYMVAYCVGALMFSAISSNARLGDTPILCLDRYGSSKTDAVTKINDKSFPLLEGAIHKTYEYQGWKIRAAFLELDGPAVRMEFQKLSKPGVNTQIQDYEIEAILTANSNGGQWTPVAYNNPNSPNKGASKAFEAMIAGASGQKMWQRPDGAIAWLRGFTLFRLELPAARQYEEQLKRAKEQKARNSVPQF